MKIRKLSAALLLVAAALPVRATMPVSANFSMVSDERIMCDTDVDDDMTIAGMPMKNVRVLVSLVRPVDLGGHDLSPLVAALDSVAGVRISQSGALSVDSWKSLVAAPASAADAGYGQWLTVRSALVCLDGGLAVWRIDREMYTGDVIYAEQTPVGEFETAGELFDRLAVMGADLLVRTLRDVDAGAAPRTPQDHSAATYTRPLTRDDSPIDWNQSPRAIIKHICGLEPWPVATAQLGGQTFKIHAADFSDRTTHKAPGTIVAAGKDGVTVACADGETVRITQLQAPGKKRMSAADYLLGHTLPVEG